MAKIIVMSTFADTLLNIRGDMMAAMVNCGHEVIAAAPESAESCVDKFQGMGIRYISIPLVRTGLTPCKDLHALMYIYKVLKTEKPDIIFTYQAKSISYGCIAAKMAGVKNIYSLLAGLGSIFQLTGAKGLLIRTILCTQYKIALSFCSNVFFQNQDDVEDFVRRRLVKREKTVIINGSGVNMKRFKPQPMPPDSTFLFVGRLLRDKGLIEYMEAARLVKRLYPEVKFLILGSLETNPMAVRREELQPYLVEGSVEYLGSTDDVRPYLAKCSVFVLPSYREGTSRAALEAMATARPIITTDAPGCRETVQVGRNGFMVPVKNIEALAEKMVWMIKNPREAEKMGQESLRICRERFDVDAVNQVILKTMGLLN